MLGNFNVLDDLKLVFIELHVVSVSPFQHRGEVFLKQELVCKAFHFFTEF